VNEIPTGWSNEQLSALCSLITDGSHFSPQTVPDGYPYVTVRDIGEHGIDFVNCKSIPESSFRELAKNGCQPRMDDVLFSKDGTVGKVALVESERDFVVLSSLAILRPRTEVLLPRFLKMAMQSPLVLEKALGLKTGTALRRIVLRNLKTIEVPTPPLTEQRRIIEILEEQFSRLDAALASVRTVRDKAKSFRRSLLHFALTPNNLGDERAEWASVSLADIASILNGDRGKNYPSKAFRTATGVPFVNAGHLVGGSIEMNKMDFIGADHFDRLGGGKFVPDDVLFCIRGSIGKVALNNDILNGAIASSLVVARAKNNVIPRFLFAYLSSPIAQKMAKQYNNGTAQPNLAAGDLKKFEVSLPTVDVQRGIVDFLEYQTTRLDAVLLIANELEVRIDSQRRSLLHAAFSGTLTAQWRESQSD
jgi:type I restriction enzyme S subunit